MVSKRERSEPYPTAGRSIALGDRVSLEGPEQVRRFILTEIDEVEVDRLRGVGASGKEVDARRVVVIEHRHGAHTEIAEQRVSGIRDRVTCDSTGAVADAGSHEASGDSAGGAAVVASASPPASPERLVKRERDVRPSLGHEGRGAGRARLDDTPTAAHTVRHARAGNDTVTEPREGAEVLRGYVGLGHEDLETLASFEKKRVPVIVHVATDSAALGESVERKRIARFIRNVDRLKVERLHIAEARRGEPREASVRASEIARIELARPRGDDNIIPVGTDVLVVDERGDVDEASRILRFVPADRGKWYV